MRARLIEEQNFERGISEPSDLGLGKWKIWEDDSFADQEKGTKVSLEEFSQNGGILKPGREIWKMDDSNKWPVGEYLGYDENQHIHLAKNDRFKSFPVGWNDHGVRVKTKVLYQ